MKVYKFGGTSVGLPERMHKVAGLINREEKPIIVVLSAVAGTTNSLVEIAGFASRGQIDKAQHIIENLENRYFTFIHSLFNQKDNIDDSLKMCDEIFQSLKDLIEMKSFSETEEKIVLSKGEMISTQLFVRYLTEQGHKASLINALDYMRIDETKEPDINFLRDNLKGLLSSNKADIYITQGFICRNHHGEVDNLQRGGSDYTASLIGAAMQVEEVQIWTDIDGLHNNDPRFVKNTYPIAELSFDEAAELAYFGAKILHPSSILPVKKYNTPVRLKSTLNENAPGTLISKKSISGAVKAIAAKDGITAIKIKSTRMLLAYGFLRKVFEVFEKYETPIDMITTSEVAISLTIDDNRNLEKIIDELEEFGFVEVDKNQSIICIVGNMVSEQKGVVRKIFNALSDLPIRMVSYGGSRFNISMLIDTRYKTEALNNLNSGLFEVLE